MIVIGDSKIGNMINTRYSNTFHCIIDSSNARMPRCDMHDNILFR
jgi:hypothetical protein